MADILIAYSDRQQNAGAWQRILDGIRSGETAATVHVRPATWRSGGDWYPDVQRDDRIYVVYNRLTRGHARLRNNPRLQGGTGFYSMIDLDLDLSEWEPHGIEWAWGAEFGQSWRYVRFTPGCFTAFPAWATAPGLDTHGFGSSMAARQRAAQAVAR